MAYNQAAFGSPFHLGYASVEGFTGMKSGFFGIALPTEKALWGITFGLQRGLFWLPPILLFSVPAIVMMLRERSVRLVAATCLAISAYYLLLNGGYRYWDGGFLLGPRHITPIVPFLLFAVAWWADRCGSRMRAAMAAVALLSILITVLCTSVTFVVQDDDQSILAGHLLPKLAIGHSDLVLAALHVPFFAVVVVPLLLVAATVLLVLHAVAVWQRNVEMFPWLRTAVDFA